MNTLRKAVVYTAVEPGVASANGFAARIHGCLSALSEATKVTVVNCHRTPQDQCGSSVRAAPPWELRDLLTPTRGRTVTRWERVESPLRAAARFLPSWSRLLPISERKALESTDADLVITWLPQVAHAGLYVKPGVPLMAVLEEPWEKVPMAVELAKSLRPRLDVLRQLDVPKARRLYRRVGGRADRVVCISTSDAASFLDEIPRAKLHVLPHAVDTDYLSRVGVAGREPHFDLVLLGDMTQPRNLLPTIGVLEALGRRDVELRVNVVGRIEPRARERIERLGAACAGFVVDIRPILAAAGVVAIAQAHGTGSKTTLLEAWSMGCAVVASPFAASSVRARDDELVVADGPDRMADAVIRLLRNDDERRRTAEAGRAAAVARHDIRRRGAEFVELCTEVVTRPRTHALAALRSEEGRGSQLW